MIKKFILLALISASMFISNTAQAGKFHGTYGDWNVFSVTQSGGKYCYAVSATIKRDGNYKRRGEPYFLVTTRKNGATEVSVSSGYPYKIASNVELVFDGKKTFQLFTTEKTRKIAWANDSDEDASIIANMKKGFKVRAKGHSRLKTHSIDTYSLKGFTKAYNSIQSLCK